MSQNRDDKPYNRSNAYSDFDLCISIHAEASTLRCAEITMQDLSSIDLPGWRRIPDELRRPAVASERARRRKLL